MSESAADHWRASLEAWAIPQELLDAIDESPYGWPQYLWTRRSETEPGKEPFTTGLVRSLLTPSGSLLDVGAGRGRASLPLAREGHPLLAVEAHEAMIDGLREESVGCDVTVIEGRWPEVAGQVDHVEVAVSAHVVYDVADIGPFLSAMHERAHRAVVLELTPRHPWSNLAPYYRALHGLERPEGPTAEDLVAVIRETIGEEPKIERWERDGRLWFAGWSEIEDLYGRRLVLPPERRGELVEVLGPDVSEVDGKWYVGESRRSFVTLWWET
jgi:SAM-dependent methyltransferase